MEKGLYMISGVEPLTGNALLDFYNNNKLLCWGLGLGAAYGISKLIKPTKQKSKK